MPLPDFRQTVLATARHTGLLPLLEKRHFARSEKASAEDNAKWLAEHPNFRAPPLWWMHDMYAHTSYRQYWQTGKRDAAALLALLEEYGEGPLDRIAEWGCGLGRLLRHFPKEMARTGYDYNDEAIAWCRENLKGVDFRTNSLMPPLDTEAGTFDAVYAVSVFTHLSSEAHDAWAAEIFRVLRPGGLFAFTVHGVVSPKRLLPAEYRRFKRGELVTRGHVKEGSRIYTAYHPRDYVHNHLMKDFEVLYGPMPGLGQMLYIARRPVT